MSSFDRSLLPKLTCFISCPERLQPSSGGGHTQGLADADSEREMNHVVKNITYGDLWGKGAHPGEKKAHGPPSWLLTAYEGLAHFH